MLGGQVIHHIRDLVVLDEQEDSHLWLDVLALAADKVFVDPLRSVQMCATVSRDRSGSESVFSTDTCESWAALFHIKELLDSGCNFNPSLATGVASAPQLVTLEACLRARGHEAYASPVWNLSSESP